jgi:hypothetical protein
MTNFLVPKKAVVAPPPPPLQHRNKSASDHFADIDGISDANPAVVEDDDDDEELMLMMGGKPKSGQNNNNNNDRRREREGEVTLVTLKDGNFGNKGHPDEHKTHEVYLVKDDVANKEFEEMDSSKKFGFVSKKIENNQPVTVPMWICYRDQFILDEDFNCWRDSVPRWVDPDLKILEQYS